MDLPSSPPVKIVVVDDNEDVRHLVRKVLHRYHKWELVGEAGDGMVAVEIVKQLQPDIVIMDVHMPRLNGIEATKRITASAPHSIVIGFSTYADVPTRTAMQKAGSAAFVSKEDICELPHVIERVLQPGPYPTR
jgi:DNA-binding NarL/FixJ family response regulator